MADGVVAFEATERWDNVMLFSWYVGVPVVVGVTEQ